METIPGPVAPLAPTSPINSPNTVTPPNLVKAPTPQPPADDVGDIMSAENIERVRAAHPDKAGDRPRDESGKFAKSEEKPGDKPGEKPTEKPAAKVDEKPATKPDEKPAPAKAVEKSADGKPAEGNKITGWQMARKHEKTIAELNAKIAEISKSAPAPAKPEEFKVDEHPRYKEVNEKLTKAEQRRQQLEDEIRWHDYEKSEEYQNKYYKPYAESFKNAIAEVGSFRVNTEDGNSRAATKEDFSFVLNSANPAEALAKAEKLFGANAANYIVGLRNEVLRAANAAHSAREEFRTKGAIELKSRAEAQERESSARAESFTRYNEAAQKEHPQWFSEAEGDDEGNAILKMGYMLADAAFGGQIEDLTTKQMRDPTPDEIVRINSMLRNKAGAFDRVIHRHKIELKSKEDRIAELEAELADYRSSEPGSGEGERKKDIVEDDDPFKKFG